MIKRIVGFGVFVLALTLLVTSCKKNSDDDTDLTNTDTAAKYIGTANVYVSGSTYDTVNKVNQAVYWKNQVAVVLTNGTKTANATGIAVQGNDIYVCGYVTDPNKNYIAVYWKNGAQVNLTDNTTNASTGDILINGNDIYITGFIESNAVYWKNGKRIDLKPSSGADIASTAGIAIEGSDVYISGYQLSAYFNSPALYWRNGIPIILVNNSPSYSGNIEVASGNVYVPATYSRLSTKQNDVTYWKNGVPVFLNDGSLFINPVAITVNGADVYVACNSIKNNVSVIGFFKNTKFYTLTNTDSQLSGITSLNNDTYVSGQVLYQNRSVATFWKNNIPVYLSTPIGKSGFASSITVTPL
jgi:hypothetical protein